ncbi:MAG: LysR family transcriptional regulator [Burkholderiaceae bacterium]|nr:LysR family transcriptional regulator [Burkholderiaceae bacterium]
MEFRHLRYFVVLAEELHFGRAAKRLAISQPPLSLNIQQLEASVGARLFERDSRSVQLTAAGHAFLGKAIALLAQAEQAARDARDVAQGLAGSLRVGFVGSMLQMELPQRLQAFQSAHAQLSVSLLEASSTEQLEALRQDRIDLGFVHTTHVPAGLDSRLIASQPFVLCLPAGHALALGVAQHEALDRTSGTRPAKFASPARITGSTAGIAAVAPIALRQVGHTALVSVARAVSPDYFDAITQVCAQAGWEPVARHELRHWLSVVSLVAQGQGIAVVPQALQRAGVPGVVFAPLADELPVNRTYCVWRSQRAHQALNAFLHMWPAV